MAQNQKIFVGLTGGVDADGFAEVVGISDLNNMEANPSGNGMFNRRGTVITNRYAPTLTGENAGRIAFLVDTQVPNLTDGTWKISAIDTSAGNAIVSEELFKPRTNIPGDTAESVISFDRETYVVDLGETVTIKVVRKNAIDRTVTATLASSNGTGSAGTDYTAVSQTVTFAAGETIKEVTFTSTAASQTANKTAFLTLSAPTGGATIGTPNPATVLMLASYIPVGSSFSSGNSLIRVMMYRKIQNDVTCHYLNSYSGDAAFTPYRMGPDTLLSIGRPNSVPGQVYVNLYSISKMMSDGGAYSAGAGTIGAAIKTAPYAKFPLFTAESTSEYNNLHFCAYDERYCYLFNSKNIYEIDMNAGVVSRQGAFPLIAGDSASDRPYSLPVDFFGNVYVDNLGRMIVYIEPNSGSNCALAAINPKTFQMEATTGFQSKALISPVPLRTGGYFCVDENSSDIAYYISQDMATLTSLGALGFEKYSDDMVPINRSGEIFLALDNSGTGFKDTKQMLVTSSALSTTRTFADTGSWVPGMTWFSETRAVANYVEGSTYTVKFWNTSSGASVQTCTNEDRHNGDAVDADITTTPGVMWDADPCWYHPRNVGGRVQA